MTPKMKLSILAAVVVAVGGGFTWKILHRRDLPSKRPAVVASDAPSQGSETQASAAPAATASPDASPNQSMAKTDDEAASKSVQAVRRPDINRGVGGLIGGVAGGVPRNAGLFQARGIVVSHTEHSLVLAIENEGNWEFDIPDTAKTTTGLGKGQRVVVGYTEENGRKIANSITRVPSIAATAKAATPKGYKPEPN